MPNLDANWAYGFLAAALLLFLLSTRQFALVARAAIWLVGAALLACAAIAVLGDPLHFGLLRVAEDVSTRGAQSVLSVSLAENWRTIGAAIVPMFDVFLIIATVLALIALIAFTPGEAVERLVRPLLLIVIGAALGGFLALSIVSVGLGGAPDRRAYAAILTPDDIIDGDTLRIGATSLRLWGVDAPEHDQLCVPARGSPAPCGEEAKQHLIRLTETKLVLCYPPPDRAQADALKRTFGRPIVTCVVRSGTGGDIDIAHQMVLDGYADIYRENGRAKFPDYAAEWEQAHTTQTNLWTLCTLTPEAWRDSSSRKAFLDGQPNPNDLLHDCVDGDS